MSSEKACCRVLQVKPFRSDRVSLCLPLMQICVNLCGYVTCVYVLPRLRATHHCNQRTRGSGSSINMCRNKINQSIDIQWVTPPNNNIKRTAHFHHQYALPHHMNLTHLKLETPDCTNIAFPPPAAPCPPLIHPARVPCVDSTSVSHSHFSPLLPD